MLTHNARVIVKSDALSKWATLDCRWAPGRPFPCGRTLTGTFVTRAILPATKSSVTDVLLCSVWATTETVAIAKETESDASYNLASGLAKHPVEFRRIRSDAWSLARSAKPIGESYTHSIFEEGVLSRFITASPTSQRVHFRSRKNMRPFGIDAFRNDSSSWSYLKLVVVVSHRLALLICRFWHLD